MLKRPEADGNDATHRGASELAPLAPETQVGAQLAGYQITDVAGRGGMGVVYRAKHLHLDRDVALKVLAPDIAQSQDFRDRFLRESRTAASINHPSIITVYDAGEAEGLLYIAMQFVEGDDLGELIARDGPLEPRRAVSFLGQIAGALDAAHARGVVHRDVKPANVMIESEHCYLTDFGLTKRISSQTALTAHGQFVGTVHYTAPEQIEGKEVDARTDVYALGCLAYHALTGHVPFERESEVSVVFAHMKDPPPPLAKLRPDLPTGIGTVLATALAKKKEDRHASCGELVSALQAELHGGSTAAKPAQAGAADAKILIASEEPRTRALVRATLKGSGRPLQVLEAADRDSLLATAASEQPAAVILDYRTLGGDEALSHALHDGSETANTTVIALVADERSGREALAGGADDWIATPFSSLKLLYKVRDAVGDEGPGA